MSRFSSPIYVWTATLSLVFVPIFDSGCMLLRGVTRGVTDAVTAVSPATMEDLKELDSTLTTRLERKTREIDTITAKAADASVLVEQVNGKIETQEALQIYADKRIARLQEELDQTVVDMRPLVQTQRDLYTRVDRNIVRNEHRERALETRLAAVEHIQTGLGTVRTDTTTALERTMANSRTLSDAMSRVTGSLRDLERSDSRLRAQLSLEAETTAGLASQVDSSARIFEADHSKLTRFQGWMQGVAVLGTIIGVVISVLAIIATTMISRHHKVLDKTREQSLAALRRANEARAEARAISAVVSSEPAILGAAAERYRSAVKQDGEAVRDAFDEVVSTLSKTEQVDLLNRCKDTLPAQILQFLVDVAEKKPEPASSPSA